MAGDRGKLSLRTTDQAVRAPQRALRSFSEPVGWAILLQTVGGSTTHPGNAGLDKKGKPEACIMAEEKHPEQCSKTITQ